MMAFKWDFDLGQVLLAASMLVGVTIYVTSGHDAVSHLTNDVQDTKKQLTDKIQDTKNDLATQIQGLRGDIANLPDVRAQGVQLERRETELERRSDASDSKISDLNSRVTKVEAAMQLPSFRQTR